METFISFDIATTSTHTFVVFLIKSIDFQCTVGPVLTDIYLPSSKSRHRAFPTLDLCTVFVRLLSHPGNYYADLFHNRLITPVHELDTNGSICMFSFVLLDVFH